MIANKPHWSDALDGLGACPEAVGWARKYRTPGRAWAACERADWMLWICGRLAGEPWSEPRKQLVRAAVDCAWTALEFIRDEDDRAVVMAALQAFRAWAEGETDQDEVREARVQCYQVYADAYAANAAADAAYADAAAANAAAANAATTAAAWEQRRMEALREMTAIVREYYPTPPSLGGSK